MEYTTESKPEEQQEERVESRSAYQKRKREEEKQTKRRGRKCVLLLAFVFVILAGVLCGTVIAGTINTPQDTVQIASANAQYVKDTVQSAVKEKVTGFSELLHNITEPDNSAVHDASNPGAENMHGVAADIPDDTNTGEGVELDTEPQTTTESAITVPAEENPYGIDATKPMIALTFDDGPSKYTWSVVRTLMQYDARATFFLVGNRVATHEAAIDFLLENNQEVASHGFSHANLVKCSDEELLAQIQNTDAALQKQHDYTPSLIRVPYGERDSRVLEALRQQGKPVIGWSVDTRDWEVQDKDTIVKHVLSHVKDGDIILMHDLYKPTADAVAELVPELQKRGYQLVTVSELFQYKGIALTPGTYYYASWKWV